MSLTLFNKKIKSFFGINLLLARSAEKHLKLILIIWVLILSYSLGYLSFLNIENNPIYLVEDYFSLDDSEHAVQIGVVASKNGSKYYYSWCGGISRIKEENRIYFDSVDMAKNKGFSKSSNCPGY